MAFGKEIKRLRNKHNISAQVLADAIGIDAERLRKWELNDFDPRGEDTVLIEKYFGMPIDQLMKQKELPKVPKRGNKKTTTVVSNFEEEEAHYGVDVTKQALLKLVDSNKVLADSNKVLAEANKELAEAHHIIAKNNDELLQLTKRVIGSVGEEIPQAVQSKLTRILAILAEVGVGKSWKSIQEGIAILSSKMNAPEGAPQETGTHRN